MQHESLYRDQIILPRFFQGLVSLRYLILCVSNAVGPLIASCDSESCNQDCSNGKYLEVHVDRERLIKRIVDGLGEAFKESLEGQGECIEVECVGERFISLVSDDSGERFEEELECGYDRHHNDGGPGFLFGHCGTMRSNDKFELLVVIVVVFLFCHEDVR